MLDTDLQYYKSETVSDDATNGGRMSANVITSGVAQNVWPNVFKSERDAGSTKYRKIFCKANSDDNVALQSNKILIDLPTAGDDWVVAFVATDTDTQADISPAARKYGAASLKADVNAGESLLIVTVDDVSLTTGNDQIFQDGDIIRVTSKPTPDSSTGTEETLTVASHTVSGNDITLLTTTPLVNAYSVAGGSRVNTVYEPSEEVQATNESFVVTSSGDLAYDSTNYPPTLNNQGCVTQVFTLTFQDSTNFAVTGDSLTSLPSGTKNADYAAPNASFPGKNYIELNYLGFTGTPVAGDTIVITVAQAALPIWFKRVVPPACGSLSNNKTVTAWTGESV